MITAESVTRCFGPVRAVDEVSFSLGRDQIVGFVGPNGAGKSTLLKMLATYLLPTAGRMTVAGIDVIAAPLEVRRRIGYLSGDTPLYADMRVDRLLAFVARARGVAPGDVPARLRKVVESCALEAALGKRVKECSTGYRKRLGLALALLHDPEVILLDEPTHGLDPLQVVQFRKLLKSLRGGRTILLSTHIISEVASLADRLLIIHRGRLLADGPTGELCRREGLAKGDVERLFLNLVRRDEGARGGADA
jgi:ABC-2 type transport system ATP-binding protein